MASPTPISFKLRHYDDGGEVHRLACKFWNPEAETRILMVHGLHNHSEGEAFNQYRGDFLAKGWGVCTVDLPNHGFSEGTKRVRGCIGPSFPPVVISLLNLLRSPVLGVTGFADVHSTPDGATGDKAPLPHLPTVVHSPEVLNHKLVKPTYLTPTASGAGSQGMFRSLGESLGMFEKGLSPADDHGPQTCLEGLTEADLGRFKTSLANGGPVFILGESMGGLISLHLTSQLIRQTKRDEEAAMKEGKEDSVMRMSEASSKEKGLSWLAGLLLLAPAVDLVGLGGVGIVRDVLSSVSWLMPSTRIPREEKQFYAKKEVHDRQVAHPGYVSEPISMMMAHNMTQNSCLATFTAEHLHIPVLILHGDQDETCSIEGSRALLRLALFFSNSLTLITLPGGVHQLQYDMEHEEETISKCTRANVLGFIEDRQAGGEAQESYGITASYTPTGSLFYPRSLADVSRAASKKILTTPLPHSPPVAAASKEEEKEPVVEAEVN